MGQIDPKLLPETYGPLGQNVMHTVRHQAPSPATNGSMSSSAEDAQLLADVVHHWVGDAGLLKLCEILSDSALPQPVFGL
jgi:hypothetical protein